MPLPCRTDKPARLYHGRYSTVKRNKPPIHTTKRMKLKCVMLSANASLKTLYSDTISITFQKRQNCGGQKASQWLPG